jgi:hypothetical protein
MRICNADKISQMQKRRYKANGKVLAFKISQYILSMLYQTNTFFLLIKRFNSNGGYLFGRATESQNSCTYRELCIRLNMDVRMHQHMN